MSDHCCCSAKQAPAKMACPGCDELAESVSITTLLHQLKAPWKKAIGDQQYYFCRQSSCQVVYFNQNDHQFKRGDLRQSVGQKSTDDGRIICYCFDIRASDLSDEETTQQCHEYVVEKTRDKLCSCDTHNPSGRCCLRDFPKSKE